MCIFKIDAFWKHCICHIFVSVNDLLDTDDILYQIPWRDMNRPWTVATSAN
jgi:hypothetical protein